MKKSLAVIFAMAILLSLVGCDKDNPESSSLNTESKIESKVESKAESKTESKAESKSESKTESKVESKAESKTESKAESKSESKAESKAESKTESKTESKAEKLPADSVNNKTKIPETNITFDSSCAFLGNSLFGDLEEYNLVDKADVYSYIGMNVATVFDQKLDNHKKPMLDEMLSKDYKNIFIMFGVNEVGWSYPDIFTDDYAELVDEIHTSLPDANIYLLSITPITQSLEAKGEDGMNIKNIAKFNTMIKNVAKKHNASYLDVNSYLRNEYGYLDEDDSPDGYHLQPNAYLRMVNAMKYLIA